MPQRKPRVGISTLARYAEDPVKFCKAKGKPFSAVAVKVGDDFHERFARSAIPSRWAILCTAVLLGLLAAYLYAS